MFHVKNTTPLNKNDAGYNNVNGQDYDNDDDDDDNEQEQMVEEFDDAVNEVLSSNASDSGDRINDAGIRYDDGGDVKK